MSQERAAPATSPSAPAPVPPRAASRGIDIVQILATAVQKGGSDVIFTVGSKPRIRIGGRLRGYGEEILTPEATKRTLYSLLNEEQKSHFEEDWEVDASVSIKNVGRFRLNGFRQRGHVAAALRVIPSKMPTVEGLELPRAIIDIADYPRGLVLVTGPTGSGKSTLLAALINKINTDRECHIITVEDPIEFVHPHIRSVVEQREIGADSKSFGNALKYMLRQNPDVILVGEMRDRETIQAAITLAETGHLVFSTLHTQTCAQTMDRIIDSFPAESQNQIRAQLSLTVKAVVCQSLLPAPDGNRCVAAREIMFITPAVASLIREGKQHMLGHCIQTGRAQGMITMEAHIKELLEQGSVDPKVAMARLSALENYGIGVSETKVDDPFAKPDRPKSTENQPVKISSVEDVPSVSQRTFASAATERGRGSVADIPRQPFVLVLAAISLVLFLWCRFGGSSAFVVRPYFSYIRYALWGSVGLYLLRFLLALFFRRKAA